MNEKKLAEICASLCQEKKAENVVILDLENRSSVADYFVICSGYSDRQVAAVAEHVFRKMQEMGIKARSKEGLSEGRWALLDFGSVIVHVFQDQLRDYFHIESLWADAPRIRLQDGETKNYYQGEFGASAH
jgi:ribosome-associated protein